MIIALAYNDLQMLIELLIITNWKSVLTVSFVPSLSNHLFLSTAPSHWRSIWILVLMITRTSKCYEIVTDAHLYSNASSELEQLEPKGINLVLLQSVESCLSDYE